MGEFGLGNIISVYSALELKVFDLGVGAGYLFYNDKENDTSIHIIEPAFLVMKQISLIIFRLRTGLDFISENKFELRKRTITISPDLMLNIKGIYAGISLPIIIGKEGTGVGFSVGTGYRYTFSF